MARPFPSTIQQPDGHLEFEKVNSGFTRVFFTPSTNMLPTGAFQEDFKRVIFESDLNENLLTIYPYQVWGILPMRDKYLKLGSISFDINFLSKFDINSSEAVNELLENVLPDSFVQDYNYGLGFKKNYKAIVSVLEEFKIEKLFITLKGPTAIDLVKKEAIVKRSDLEILIKKIDRITQRTQKVSLSLKKETTSQSLIDLLTNAKSNNDKKLYNSELTELIKNSPRQKHGLITKREQSEAIEVIRKNSKKIISEQPEELIKLRNDIELVTLEELIKKFEEMLVNKHMQEYYWQKLLDENPFILNMAFGIPVVKVQSQASMGGHKFSGSGNKVADFLVKNSITNNAAIIEIKTPFIKIINSTKYRSGILTPSAEMTGAVNQLLDQIYFFQREINSLKNASRENALESYFVTGILIAGLSLTDVDEQKSFELFRGNSKSVQIITFDELLHKLKDLHAFLKPEIITPTLLEDNNNNDLPF